MYNCVNSSPLTLSAHQYANHGPRGRSEVRTSSRSNSLKGDRYLPTKVHGVFSQIGLKLPRACAMSQIRVLLIYVLATCPVHVL